MSAIDTALRRINATIPKEILKQAYMPRRYDPARGARYYDNTLPISTDAVITDAVIKGRVMRDIDLVSGSEVLLRLRNSRYELIDQFNTIYRFDETETRGRTITSVYEVTYGYANNTMVGQYGGYGNYSSRTGQALKAARDVIRSAGGSPPQSTAYVQLIGHNTILVNDVTPIANYGVLRAMVGNEPNMNNLKAQYEQVFAELCLLAAKSKCWTELVIEIDESQLRGGQAIGRFREIVDQYMDAETMYAEQLDKWQKIGHMNDTLQYRKTMRMALGNRPKY